MTLHRHNSMLEAWCPDLVNMNIILFHYFINSNWICLQILSGFISYLFCAESLVLSAQCRTRPCLCCWQRSMTLFNLLKWNVTSAMIFCDAASCHTTCFMPDYSLLAGMDAAASFIKEFVLSGVEHRAYCLLSNRNIVWKLV